MYPQPSQRFFQLDALRGLAAVTVVFAHVLHVLPKDHPEGIANLLATAAARTPLAIVFAGHEAVILFFVLSGFVLSLPYLEGRPLDYGSYLVRRVFRIYVPYLCSVGGAIAANALFYGGEIEALSHWFNRVWAARISLSSICDHVLFLGCFPNAQFNPIYWSLVHEMRISVFFPFVALFLLRLSWRGAFASALGVSLVGVIANKISGSGTDYFYTLHYLGFFILGHLLARHRTTLGRLYAQQSSWVIGAVLCAGIAAYTGGKQLKFIVLQDWMIGAGASIFIVLSLSSSRMSALLAHQPIRFLGQVSYSLYLWHAVVLVSLVHLLYDILPLWCVLGLAFVGSLILAAGSYRFIEAPAIGAGKRICETFKRKQAMRTLDAALAAQMQSTILRSDGKEASA
jgi:peptidoglycan/LPS O-acetylase OafA/YrhL